MNPKPFHFKKFSMMHHQSTMKIGTDAILLGAWVDLLEVSSALDVGTGSGILAMMLAQRGVKHIEAVEVDEKSCAEAKLNFETSHWRDSFKIYHQDARNYAINCVDLFDLIICNPPFFYQAFPGKQMRRNLARHTGDFDFSDLFEIALRCLKKEGKLAVVIPVSEFNRLMKAAAAKGFFLHQKLVIIPVSEKAANRFNLVFKLKKPTKIHESEFTIRNTDGNFTTEYNELLKPYYLGL